MCLWPSYSNKKLSVIAHVRRTDALRLVTDRQMHRNRDEHTAVTYRMYCASIASRGKNDFAVFLKTNLETLDAEIQCAKLQLMKTSETLKMTELVNNDQLLPS